MAYPDPEFMQGLFPPLRRLSRSALGRRLVTRLVRGRFTGPLTYRYSNLPLTVIARKPGAAARPA
jgi:hypothetical protein